MRQFLQHKWVIGAGALVLVVALGAIAWAAPDSSSTTVPSATPQAGPQAGPAGGGLGLGDMGGGGMMRRGRGGAGPAADPGQSPQNMQQRRADMQARGDAFLKLVKDKMTAEDQKKLDALTATAKQQRDALDAARTSLMQTTSDLRSLVGKYFPGGTTTGSATTDSGSTSTTPSVPTN